MLRNKPRWVKRREGWIGAFPGTRGWTAGLRGSATAGLPEQHGDDDGGEQIRTRDHRSQRPRQGQGKHQYQHRAGDEGDGHDFEQRAFAFKRGRRSGHG